MSPEQAEGGRIVDGHTDIYALGATLYEGLLAVEPDARDFRSEMAMTHADLALLMRAAGSVDRVIEAIQRVVALRRRIARRSRSCDDSIEAARIVREATLLAPENGAYWNTLGVANCRLGNWHAAAAALEQSMRYQSGGDPYDWLFLAMAHTRMGTYALARIWYDR
jgi:tetratricopeptide (TPR) repeat protein